MKRILTCLLTLLLVIFCTGCYQEVTVQKDDTWWGIATEHGITPEELAEYNGKTVNDIIYPGDIIKVPVTFENSIETSQTEPTEAELYVYVPEGKDIYELAEEYNTTAEKILAENPNLKLKGGEFIKIPLS